MNDRKLKVLNGVAGLAMLASAVYSVEEIVRSDRLHNNLPAGRSPEIMQVVEYETQLEVLTKNLDYLKAKEGTWENHAELTTAQRTIHFVKDVNEEMNQVGQKYVEETTREIENLKSKLGIGEELQLYRADKKKADYAFNRVVIFAFLTIIPGAVYFISRSSLKERRRR